MLARSGAKNPSSRARGHKHRTLHLPWNWTWEGQCLESGQVFSFRSLMSRSSKSCPPPSTSKHSFSSSRVKQRLPSAWTLPALFPSPYSPALSLFLNITWITLANYICSFQRNGQIWFQCWKWGYVFLYMQHPFPFLLKTQISDYFCQELGEAWQHWCPGMGLYRRAFPGFSAGCEVWLKYNTCLNVKHVLRWDTRCP